MDTTRFTNQEIGRLGEDIYEQRIRDHVETPENIGKMVIIDIETADYEIDDLGLTSARSLQASHPGAVLYGRRIGYNVAESLGGVMERTSVPRADGRFSARRCWMDAS
jgi:hypothetical protein